MKQVQLPRRLTLWVGGIAGIVFGLAALVGAAAVWTDYLWYESLSQGSILWIRLASQAMVWCGAAAVGFAITFLAARAAWKCVADKPRFNNLTALACFLLAGTMAWTISRSWMVFRLAAAQAPFGITDPQFGLDVGFFVFTLPALELLTSWLIGLCVLAMVLVVAITFISTRLDTTGEIRVDWWRLKKTLSVLVGLLMLTTAANYWIAVYRVSFSVAETPFVGASYADVRATIPAYWILVGLSVLVAVALFATAGTRRFKPVVLTFGVWVAAALVLGSLWPMLVQTFVAAPNEATLEAPYIARNISMTRTAFDLSSVKSQAYPALTSISASAAAAAERDLQDATIWTPDSVRQAFNQLQQIRPYYKLSPSEYDRYEYKDTLNQVLVSAREIDTSALPDVAQTWVNQHLVYTHGFGLAISSTSRTSESGFPQFIVGDVPPRIISDEATGAASLTTVEPRIYFGPSQTDYAVVNAGIDEFDYPRGERNATNRYAESSGVTVGGPLRRLAFAVALGSSDLFFSRYVQPESRILLNRGIERRAAKLAPWLVYDAPYAAIADGRVVWIMDAKTSSSYFPCSQPLKDGTNYLRDSVKVTVDASSGDITFYAVGDDPIRDAWARIFPTILRPLSDMPVSVAQHVRAPQELFAAQASVFRTYHMTDTTVFYNKEDLWQISKDNSGNTIQPAYLMLDLPDRPGKGMYLLQPFSLPNRDNLVGWMATSCEPGSYGERTVYRLPKERTTLGSAQVSARINQDPDISQQLSLWTQPGSSVSFGTMLVLPVEGTVAYIQPLFLQAQKSAITQLASVIAVNGDRVKMKPTLEGALSEAWGAGGITSLNTPEPSSATTPGAN